MKTAEERLNDTKAYLSNQLTPAQYNEVMNLIGAYPNKTTLGQLISIGNINPFNSTARRAKRSLMLLAELLIANKAFRDGEVARIKNLPEGSESSLVNEIKSWFTLPGITGDKVAEVAKTNILKMPKWDNINFDASDAIRGVYHSNKPFNCYNGCVFWAFQAGAISKRYLWNFLQGTNGIQFFPTYSRVGWDTLIEWANKQVVRDASNGGEINVPAGRTIYFVTPAKVFGHVACSLGNGTVISQNSVYIGDSAMNPLPPLVKAEFERMAHAVTHIISIRELVTLWFNPKNGYDKLQVSSGNFWDPIPLNAR